MIPSVLPSPRIRRRRAAATIAARLTMEGVSRRFDRVPALDNIDLDVAPGEVVSLLGHSGCGKTTLLRIAAGVEVPDAGRVLVDGREGRVRLDLCPAREAQHRADVPGLRAVPASDDPAQRHVRADGAWPQDRETEARAALARVGLERLADHYPHEASGGEQQRCALARAVVPRPGILLMDEPFSGLDSRLRESVRADTLSVLRETGATAVLVTHDPEEAMRPQ
jgi:iron(III) transport system ATP-binding protein